MSRNGAGTYTLPAGNPVVTGTTISSTWANNTLTDIANALTASIANDGQTPITANLPMTGFRHTGVGNASARDSYAASGQVQDGSFLWGGTGGGTADVITFTVSPAITAYAAGQCFRFISSGANTTNVTVNINSLGAKALTKNGSTALVAGDIPSGVIVEITYDGTRFQITKIKQGSASTQDTGTSGANVPLLNGANTWSGVQTFSVDPVIQSTDSGATAAPFLNIDRNSVSPAASDVLGAVAYKGRDSGGNTTIYAQTQGEIVDATDGSEDGIHSIQTIVAGTLATRGYIGQGLVMGSPTSGDKGAGTANVATGYYLNGFPIYGYVLDSQSTAGASLLEFTFNTSFTQHVFFFSNIRPSSAGGSLYCQVGDGGGYKTTVYQYHTTATLSSASTYAGASSTSDSQYVVVSPGMNATHGCAGWLMIDAPDGTTSWKKMTHKVSAVASTGNAAIESSGSGEWANGTGALTKIKFFVSGGFNIVGRITYVGLPVS